MLKRVTIFKIRLVIFKITTSVFFIIIIARLFYLQVIMSSTLFHLGKKNFLRVEKIISPRGNIIDINGKLLATNKPIISLYWNGTGKKQLTQEQYAIIHTLENILGKDLEKDIALIEKKTKKTLIAHELQFDQLSKIIEHFPHHSNLFISTCFKRYYPYNSYGSHVIGHLSILGQEIYGKMGLEMLLEESLKGESGQKLKMVNSAGHNLSEEEVKKALTGQTIQTTLNIDLMHIAESVFPQDFAGVLLVMHPQTGALQVVMSRPGFDPNTFLSPINEQEWFSLQHNNSFLNRALSTYPPASIFKLVTIAAALENNIIQEDIVWNCRGFVTFAGRKYHCSNHNGHGLLNIEGALAQSCNIPLFDIARHIKIDMLAAQAKKFGLGSKTNILFSEKTGLIPTSSWKKATFHERWYPGETLSASIGQSYLLVTPIQIARMISGICQGYLVKPRILVNEPQEKEHLDISPEVRQFLKKSMKQVITEGSGRRLKNLKNIEIWAKTGTAQTGSLEKRDEGKHYLEHAWFVAQVVYKDNEPFTLVILIEHAGSSRVALSVAWNYLINYCYFMDHGVTLLTHKENE
ncbi:MAG: penicillin-binding transpeptidase domain-containing protein [Candidatus Babeliaceae bacterium]|jgi:penicillin-binding protein 2